MENEIKKNKKICVIDDEPDLLEIYKTKFQLSSFDVVTARDGEEGMAVIRAEKPDMILLDIIMPKKDGISLLKDLQADEALKSIPVIMLSNVSDEKTVEKVGKFSTHFYVLKSMATPQKLVDLVREALH